MKKKGRISPAFTTIFLSYLAICLILLCATGIGYGNYYRLLKKQMVTITRQQAVQTASEIENGFQGIQSSLSMLTTNHVVQETLDYTDEELSKNVPVINKLRSEIIEATKDDSRVSTLLYFFESDSILLAQERRYNTSMMELFYKSYGMTEKEFQEIIDFRGRSAVSILGNGKVWLMSPVFDSYYEKKAILIMEANIRDFAVSKLEGSALAILAGEQTLFSDNIPEEHLADFPELGSATDTYFEKDGYFFVPTKISSMGWECFVGLSKEPLMQGLRIFWYVLAGEVIGCVFLMLFLSWRATKRLYQPLEDLLKLLDAQTDLKYQETYAMLSDKLRNLRKTAKTSQIFLDNHQINQVLSGEVTETKLISKIMTKLTGIREDRTWVMAVVDIPVEQKASLDGASPQITQDGLDLRSFVLKNIADELFFTEYHGNIFWQNERYLLCIEQKSDEDSERILEKLQYLMDFYGSTLHIGIHVVVGEPITGFEATASVWETLQDEMKYRIFWMDDASRGRLWIQKPESANWPSTSLEDYTNASRKLLNFLDAGEYMEAYETLDYIFSKTFSRERKYLKYNQYRMYGLAAMLTTSIGTQGDKTAQESPESPSYEELLLNAGSVEELMSVSKELFAKIIDQNSRKEKPDEPGWLSGVLRYLQENFRDPNLTVGAVAEKFWISVPHLSRTFKSCTGKGVLEYIQFLRVEESKHQLLNGKNVTEAAVSVGYLDAKALTRAFKRYEGITPGKYKELHKGQ
ncbi:MAG: AraC family transcriptional regulator [Eubacteriales bacterium]|nr:AraC family transcriptional regulator [Eubacteriales bacterium]